MIHHAQVNGAGHVAGPDVKVPARTDAKGVPTGANQRRGSIVVVLQDELAAMQCYVAVRFGIRGLLGDIEREFFVRHELGDAFLDDDSITKSALPIGAHEIAAVRRCRRIGKSQPKNPVIGRIGNFGKREHVRPDFRRRRLNQYAVGHDGLLLGVVNRFAEREQREQRKNREVELRIIRPKPDSSEQNSAESKNVKRRRDDHEANDAFVQDDRGRGQADESEQERIESAPSNRAINAPPEPRRDQSDKKRNQEKAGPGYESSGVVPLKSSDKPNNSAKQAAADCIRNQRAEHHCPENVARR